MSATFATDAATPLSGTPRRANEHTCAHVGTFAAGQETAVHHPERPEANASFAEGAALHKHVHPGTFAAGQEITDPHPELPENRGNFAAGQRRMAVVASGN